MLITFSTAFTLFKVFLAEPGESLNHPHESHVQDEKHSEEKPEEKSITLSPDQIKRFDIQTMTLSKSHFQKRLTFPGQITLNENKVTHVVPTVPGTVKDIFKGLGDTVKLGESLATIQSREMAEAKSAYLSAHKNLSLQKDLYERDEKLLKQKVKAEVQFIQTRNLYENAKINLEQAKQKLLALSMTEEQINKLADQNTPLNLYTIDAPIDGKIIERHLTLGEVISNDGQVFVIANLDTVWVNLAISSEELPMIKKDQKVDIFAHGGQLICSGTIMYVSPVMSEESRTGRAIIELSNTERKLHPGDFIKAQIVVDETADLVSLPSSALQRDEQGLIVFKKTATDKFEPQRVSIKEENTGDFVEIVNGLSEGDEIVIKNSFLLKAELEKSEAEHSH
ncbi:MAG: efflux RND transporter periplasmic adaptor subunit [Candidatus Puniceispirillum sp.]|nr:efflux RND transporter periplasmic adaptor subunit [Candidatus Puniceispirillum sp.]